MHLETARREELIALIAQQQATITALEATIAALEVRIAELEARLAKGGPPKGMPGHKPQQPDATRPKKTRKRRPHGFARVRDAVPTATVRHALDACPTCGCPLVGGSVKRTREVLEVRPSPVQIIEHQYVERRCPQCGTRWTPKVELDDVVLGQSRIGIGLASLIATLREAARLPVETVQWYLATCHGLHLSVGAIVGVLDRVAAAGAPQREAMLAAIRASPVAHGDETGWREQGHNGYVWTFSTPSARYFTYGRREKDMVDQVLGEEFAGVLVSDFYAAYNHYAGLKQRCWSHLLREIHDLRVAHPDDATVQTWATAVHALLVEAKREAAAISTRSGPEQQRVKGEPERRLWVLNAPYAEDTAAPQRKLAARMQHVVEELFVFVVEPAFPADNNPAERSLRHLVTSRKISGGTRSAKGTATKMALSSLFGTWHARGLNPWLACQEMLAAPQI
jgi:transposase